MYIYKVISCTIYKVVKEKGEPVGHVGTKDLKPYSELDDAE